MIKPSTIARAQPSAINSCAGVPIDAASPQP
jgi:hypothetical protein